MMQYVFIIYMHKNCKIPCRFLGILSWRRFCRFSSTRNILSIFLGSMTWALYCKTKKSSELILFSLQTTGTIPNNPKEPTIKKPLKGIFFSISLFRLSVSTPPRNTQKTSKNHHSYPSPPPPQKKITDTPNKNNINTNNLPTR